MKEEATTMNGGGSGEPGFVSGAGAPSATPGHFLTQKAKRIALRLLC